MDLDSTKLTPPTGGYDEISPLPEPEGTILKNHLKQVSRQRRYYPKAGKHPSSVDLLTPSPSIVSAWVVVKVKVLLGSL